MGLCDLSASGDHDGCTHYSQSCWLWFVPDEVMMVMVIAVSVARMVMVIHHDSINMKSHFDMSDV